MSPSNGAMFRSKSRFATASTTSSDIATSNNRSEPTCHGFRFRSNGTSVTQHKSGINSMANATPVESRPKKRPMNSKPNKPTTPIPMMAGAPRFAGLPERFVISSAAMAVVTMVAANPDYSRSIQ